MTVKPRHRALLERLLGPEQAAELVSEIEATPADAPLPCGCDPRNPDPDCGTKELQDILLGHIETQGRC